MIVWIGTGGENSMPFFFGRCCATDMKIHEQNLCVLYSNEATYVPGFKVPHCQHDFKAGSSQSPY